MARTQLNIKRIYEPPEEDDGLRILVDRIWPRGVSKGRAKLDAWERELGPSDELRKWFGHDPEKYDEFCQRYRAELVSKQELVNRCLKEWGDRRVTLLYSARDTVHNQAAFLQAYLTPPA